MFPRSKAISYFQGYIRCFYQCISCMVCHWIFVVILFIFSVLDFSIKSLDGALPFHTWRDFTVLLRKKKVHPMTWKMRNHWKANVAYVTVIVNATQKIKQDVKFCGCRSHSAALIVPACVSRSLLPKDDVDIVGNC